MTPDILLFDLDGTLTDPGIGITNSVMYALGKYGIQVPDRAELYPFIGPPLSDSFARFYGFGPEQALEAVAFYREYFSRSGILENELYPEIPAVLRELREGGKRIVLATSKPEEYAVRILRHFGLDVYFHFIGAATMDGSISRKEDVIRHTIRRLSSPEGLEALQLPDIPGPERFLMIGDRDQDILGAKANGIRSLGVLYGYGDEAELSGAGADLLVRTPGALRRCLAEDLLRL